MAEAPRYAHFWKEDETALMLAQLKELNILKYMDGRKTRNGDLFKKVAEQLKEAGFARTADQVLIRWKHLKRGYYQSRKNGGISGRNTVACPFANVLEERLGPRPSSQVNHDGEDTGFDSPLDDGKLSLEEFQAFFSDGTLNEEELEKLFHIIDSDNTSNVDTKELCDYFAKHMGDYEGVLASLETLNLSILKAMDFTKKVYEKGTNVEQFVTRFLLKESANQIQSLLNSVESAVDAIDEQHRQSCVPPAKMSPRISGRQSGHIVPDYPTNNRITTKEALKTLNNASGTGEPDKEGLDDQISRLAKLIGRLEDKTFWFDLHQRLTDADGTASESLLLIRQEMVVSQKKLAEFCEALKQYLQNVSIQKECFHVTAVRLPDGLSFVIYEFWTGHEEWKQHLQAASTKTFQHVKVDALCQPEAVSSVAVPAAWCSVNRDSE